jgi:hypothetical protein
MKVEHLFIGIFVLTAVLHSWFLPIPFWVYLLYGAAYAVLEVTGLNDEEL